MTPYAQRWLIRCKTWTWLVLLTVLAGFTFSVPVMAETAGSGSETVASDGIFRELAQGQRLVAEKTYRTPEQPTVYLTFDDGPSKLTGQVLDILAKEHIQATFFALGESAETHPEMIQRILAEGHTLGNHSYNHVYAELYGNFQSFWEQISKTERIFQRIAGVQPSLVRAPGGTYTNFDPFYFYLMEQAGYTMIDWTADSGDSRRAGVPTAEIIKNVKDSKLTHEINLLFHDGAGHENTIKALPEVIRYYKEKGYAFAPLGPEVKPSQFPSGKPKWKRSWSEAAFTGLLEQARAHKALQRQSQSGITGQEPADGQERDAEALATELMRRQSETALAESEQALAAQRVRPPLVIETVGGGLTLLQDINSDERGRIEVPLRQLVERLGRQVEWEAASKTAIVRRGLTEIVYSLSRQDISVYTLGQLTAVYHLPDMRLADDTLQVSLSGALALLDARVTVSRLAGGQQIVAVSLPVGLLWPANGMTLRNSLYAFGG